MKATDKQSQLAAAANAVVSGNVDLIDGVRQICNLRFAVDDPDDETFFPLRGVESESEAFPAASERKLRSSDALARFEQEKEEYLAIVRDVILNSCREIIMKWG